VGNSRKPPSQFERFQSFVDGLWDGSSIRLGSELSRVEKFAHFWVLVFRSFARNRCPVHAYALSYTTLLALVPMLAVVLSLTSSMLKGESEERIGQFIDRLVMAVVPAAADQLNSAAATNAPPETQGPSSSAASVVPTNGVALTNPAAATATNDVSSTNIVAQIGTNAPTAAQLALARIAKKPEVQEVRMEAARNIRQFIENTWSGTMGAVGTVLLLYIAITMLARIEDTFNDIWGVARGRTWFMRIVLYWAVISLVPLLLIAALTLASGPHFTATRELLTRMPFIGSFIFQLLPLLMLWLTFSAFYKLVPNTRIDWTAALAGGAVCAILWHVNNAVSVLYVSRVVTNSRIYGSLGMVPVFMIGLYFSWFFLLLGAQFAYAWQNRAAYLQEKLAERVDQRGREFIALRLMTCVGQYFQAGEPAASVTDMSATLGVPSRLTQQIMQTLRSAQLVSEVAGKNVAYLPARPLETITCHDILVALRTTSGQQLPRRDEPATDEVLGEFERIQSAERAAAASVTLSALVNRAQARLRLAAPTVVEPDIKPVAAVTETVKPKAPAAPEPMPTSEESAESRAASIIQPTPVSELPLPPTETPVKAPPHEFVGIRLPSPTQPTDDEERTFPL
jgi:membrane protein